jgi:HSP20 family protein
MPFRPGGFFGDPFLSLHREVNRLFDETLRGLPEWSGDELPPSIVSTRMNVSETDSEITVTAELPGVSEKDVDVSLDDDVLAIRGEKRMEKKDEKESFHFVERAFGSFQRSVRLPYAVDPDKVEAKFENGVLTIRLPKSGQQERSRRILVQGASQGSPQIETTASERAEKGEANPTGSATGSATGTDG